MTDALTVVEVQQLYAAQSLAVDGGDADGWAATFTPDGVFDSPSYPDPARGTDALVAFAAALHAGSPHLHHVVSNLHVAATDDPDELAVRSTLLIVTTHDLASGAARIDRVTTTHDVVRRTAGGWRVAHRRVVRDA